MSGSAALHTPRALVGGVAVAVLVGVLSASPASAVPPVAPVSEIGGAGAAEATPGPLQPTTPLQEALAETVTQRRAAGLPIPEVTFTTDVSGAEDLAALLERPTGAADDLTTRVVATTTLVFHGPEEAGYEQWPPLDLGGELGNEAFSTGDITDSSRAEVAEQVPGFWDQVAPGHEAVRHTVTETYVLTPGSVVPAPLAAASAGAVSTSEDVLLGFTYTGPDVDYRIGDRREVCVPYTSTCIEVYDVEAGVVLDWALGLRLPLAASVSGPGEMVLGQDYTLQSSLSPRDWAAADYERNGVAAENGNEFAMRLKFFIGLRVELFGEDLCDALGIICNVTIDQDRSTSFATPFGVGTSFPIPGAVIPVFTLGPSSFRFTVDLTVQPRLTSSAITADWRAVPGSDCTGSGTVTYTAPDTPVPLGPVTACGLGPTDQAQVQLDSFRYHFNEFSIQLAASASLNLFGFFQTTVSSPLADIRPGPITGGPYLGRHVQCTADFHCVEVGPDNRLVLSSTTVDTTAPVTSAALDGTSGDNGWYRSAVQVSLSAVDGPVVDGVACGSGVRRIQYRLDDGAWSYYDGPLLLGDEGTTTVSFRSVDNAGNVEVAQQITIKVDTTPPALVGAPTTGPSPSGWWTEAVLVHFTASDDVSGLASVTPDATVSSEGAGQSVTGRARDVAGNEATFTVTGLDIDMTAPVVVIDSPLGTTYENTAAITVRWTATDTVSGVARQVATLDGANVTDGQTIDLRLVAAGEHTLSVTVVDDAGNRTSTTRDFAVSTDIAGLRASIEYLCAQGLVTSRGLCASLPQRLTTAERAIDRGSCRTAASILESVRSRVEALEGTAFTGSAGMVTAQNLRYVLEHLECTPRT